MKILKRTTRFEQDIKRSRFVALAAHCETEQQVQQFLEQHSDGSANHNCWAWKIGQQYRSTDDGEPGGTAGRPILKAIETQGYDQTAVLVIRWFGGIKLGAGGLSRAYGGSAAECLRTAASKPLIEYSEVEIRAPFEAVSTVHQLCEQHGVAIDDQHWNTAQTVLQARVPAHKVSQLRKQLLDQSQGQIQLTSTDFALFNSID